MQLLFPATNLPSAWGGQLLFSVEPPSVQMASSKGTLSLKS